MPSPTDEVIAEAIVTELNSTAFSLAVSAGWDHRPVIAEENTAGLIVTVVPRSRDTERVARRQDNNDYTIDVTISQAVQGATDAERRAFISARKYLAEEFGDLFARTTVVVGPRRFPCVATRIDPLLAIDRLDESDVFTTVVTGMFRETRVLP